LLGPERAAQFTKLANKCLENCEDTIFKTMRAANATEGKSVDFSKVKNLKAQPPLALLGGLRGAALLAAQRAATLDTDKAIEHLDLAFSAAAALASDPSQTSSSTSAAIAKELVPALQAIAKRNDITKERREKLEAIVNRISRTDSFGFTASLAAEREQVNDRLLICVDRQDRDAIEYKIQHCRADWLLAMRLVTDKEFSQQIEDAGELVDTTDLFPADHLKALAQSREEWSPLRFWILREYDSRKIFDLKKLTQANIPPLRDPMLDMFAGQDTLSQLDEALRDK